ncbi:MAG: MATE family efflux transporter [Clostridia bacterium]|nr:MATE family efflux transporter [Clostridia bacterium]
MFNYMKQERGFYKRVWALALPIVLQNLIMTSLGIVDTFMVGILGEEQMAGVTVANTPIFIIQLVIFGLQSGSAVLISQYWGKKDSDAVSRVIGIGFFFAGTASMAFALVMCLIPEKAMSLFTDNASLIGIASRYIRIAGFSYVFNSLTGVYTGAYRSMGNPKLGLSIFAVSMCLNTFLNWVLIFGKLGAPALGVEGAAYATLISRLVEFSIMIVHSFISKTFIIDLKALIAPGAAMCKKFIRYSAPVLFNETMWGLGTACYPTIMGHMENSTSIMAAYTVAGNIDKIATVMTFSIATTAAIIVGTEIGSGNRQNAYRVGAALSTTAVFSGLATAGILLILLYTVIDPYVYNLFGLSPLSVRIANMMLLVNCIFLASRSYNSTNIVGVLRGGGDVKAAMLIDILPLWLAAIPMAAICGLVLKTDVLWVVLAVAVENLLKFSFGLWRFRSRKWINDVTVSV